MELWQGSPSTVHPHQVWRHWSCHSTGPCGGERSPASLLCPAVQRPFSTHTGANRSKHRRMSQRRRIWFCMPLPLIIPIQSLHPWLYSASTPSAPPFTLKIPWNPFISKYLSSLQRSCGVMQWITECLFSVYSIFKNHFCSVCLVTISFPFLLYALWPCLHFIIISASSNSRLHMPRPFLAIHVAASILYEESYSFRSVFITNYTQDSREIFIHVPLVFRSHSPHYPPGPLPTPTGTFSSLSNLSNCMFFSYLFCMLCDPMSSFIVTYEREDPFILPHWLSNLRNLTPTQY